MEMHQWEQNAPLFWKIKTLCFYKVETKQFDLISHLKKCPGLYYIEWQKIIKYSKNCFDIA